jgi:hypothetical protein
MASLTSSNVTVPVIVITILQDSSLAAMLVVIVAKKFLRSRALGEVHLLHDCGTLIVISMDFSRF